MLGRVEIHLVENHQQMRERTWSRVSPWVIGACSPPSTIAIRLDLSGRAFDGALRSILAHETVHHVLSHLPRPALPRWFEEGLCVHWSTGLRRVARVWLRRSGVLDELPSLAHFDTDEGREEDEDLGLVYVAGLEALEFLLAEHGRDALRAILARVKEGRRFEEAFRLATGSDLNAFEAEWRHHVATSEPGGATRYPSLAWAGAILLLGAAGLLLVRKRARK